jgi:hypothetical protein
MGSMRRFRFRSAGLAAALFFAAAGGVRAEYVFSLDPEAGVDMQALSIGQIIPLYVNVSGMTDGDAILFFHFAESFPDAMFQVQSVEAGSSIPDASGFTSNFDATDFEIEYAGSTPVTADGILAKVTLVAIGAGGGAFALGTEQLALGSNTGLDASGLTPSFTVLPGAVLVPEPSSLALAAVGFAAAGWTITSTRSRGDRAL